jgi:hypothetical protein
MVFLPYAKERLVCQKTNMDDGNQETQIGGGNLTKSIAVLFIPVIYHEE